MTAFLKNHTPEVSIGMPVYNGAKYIREALDSVLTQTFRNYEVIISDNASDDETQLICDEYCQKDNRIKYVRQKKNYGGHWNFQYVTQQAKGRFITWLAHDDILHPMFIEETLKYMTQNPNNVLVTGDFSIIDPNGVELKVEKLIKIREDIDWEKRCVEFFINPISNVFFCIYGLMKTDICKSIIQRLPEPKVLSGSELPILARFAVLGEILSIPIVLRKYRRHPTSAYSIELDSISTYSKYRRFFLQIANLWRLRFDQMAVLYSSSLPIDFKSRIILNAILFYIFYYSRKLLRIPYRLLKF